MQAAKRWHDERRSGLGLEFEAQVLRVVGFLGSSPEIFPQVDGNIRRALVRRFPYALFLCIVDTGVIVLSCHHLRRKQRNWQERSAWTHMEYDPD